MNVLSIVVVLLVVAFGPRCLAQCRPNVVVVNIDDAAVEATNRAMPWTRAWLEGEGVTFSHAYVPASLCCPSRSSLLTGRYAHDHRIYWNEPHHPFGFGGAPDYVALGLEASQLPGWARERGYATACIGKWLNRYGQVAPYGRVGLGWDEWRVFVAPGTGPYYLDYDTSEREAFPGGAYSQSVDGDVGAIVHHGTADADYSTDVLRDRAVAFVRAAALARKPFLLYVAPYAVHDPSTPATRHLGLYPSNPGAPRKPNYATIAVNAPCWQLLQAWTATEEERYDALWADQLRCLAAVDKAFMAIVGELARDGLLINTLVIVTNDNGRLFGAHRYGEKDCEYEEAVRVGLGVYVPGAVPHRDDHVVSTIDVTATLVDYCGLAPGTPINGLSLRPLLLADDPARPFHDGVLSEGWALPGQENCPDGPVLWPTYRLVVSQDGLKYVELPTYAEREFYDLVLDPHELLNDVDNPARAPDVERLKAILDRMLQE